LRIQKRSPRLYLDLALIALLVLFFAKDWFKEGIPTSDFGIYVTWTWYLRKSLLETHRLVSWSPYWFNGVPFLVVANSFLCYFVFLLPSLFLDLTLAIKLTVVVSHILSGWTMYFLSQRLLADHDASLLASIAYALHPAHIATSAFYCHLERSLFYSVLPLFYLAYLETVETHQRKHVLLAGLFLGVMCLLCVQYTTGAGLGLALPFLITLTGQALGCRQGKLTTTLRDEPVETLKALAVALWPTVRDSLLIILIGLGLAALWFIPLLMAWDLQSPFTPDYVETLIPHMSLDNPLMLFDRWGALLRDNASPSMIYPSGIPTWLAGPYLGMFYLGLSLLALLAVGFPAHSSERTKHVLPLLAILLAGLWLSMGPYSLYEVLFPPESHLQEILPKLALSPETGTLAALGGLMILGIAIRLWQTPGRRIGRALLALLVLSPALLFLKPFVLLRGIIPIVARMRFPLRFFFLTVFALGPLVGFAVWTLKRRLSPRPFRCLYLLAVIIVLLDFYPYRHVFAWQHDPSETRQLYEQLGRGEEEYRIMSLSPDTLVDLGVIYSKKPAVWHGLVWASLRLTHTFYVKSFEPVFWKEGSRNAATLFGVANLKYLVTDKFAEESLIGYLHQAEGLEPVAETSLFSAFVNTAWRPYVQVYPRGALYVGSASNLFSFLPYLSREGIAIINGPSRYLEDYSLDSLAEFDTILLDKPRFRDAGRFEQLQRSVEGHLIQLEGREPEETSKLVSPLSSQEAEPVVEWHRPDPEEIRVNIRANRSSVMMISESWYPHWHVYVDGKERELLRVNYAFQGVRLDQGEHQVVFKYQRPIYFLLGYGLTAFTLTTVGVMLALEVWPLRRRGLSSEGR
jgi:hypothetical protein